MAVFKYYKAENDIGKLGAGVCNISCGGDKSVTHRAMMFAAMAEGESAIANPSRSLDCQASVSALERLGVKCSFDARANRLSLRSGGLKSLSAPRGFIDCANSGTTARLLMGLAAAAEGLSVFMTGDASLIRRPMGRVAAPLEAMGARIVLSSQNTLPAAVSGRRLRGIEFDNIYNSAQVKAALILAASGAAGRTVITERIPTRDHSELMAEQFGLELKKTALKGGGARVAVRGPQKAVPASIAVPNDPSSAAFYIALDALFQVVYGRRLKIKAESVLVNQSRSGFYECLFDSGFDMIYTACSDGMVEKSCDLEVNFGGYAPPSPQIIDSPARVVSMIDEIPLAALALTFARGESYIGGLSELRFKETDRLAAVAAQLNKMGAKIKAGEDSLIIRGVKKLKGAAVDSGGDHRIAMTLIIAGILSGADFSVSGCECVAVSNPSFFEDLKKIGFVFHIA